MTISVAQYVQHASWFSAVTPRSTPATLNWTSGDYIVIVGLTENNLGTMGNPTNANLTAAAPKASITTGGGTEAGAYVWQYTAGSSQTSQAIACTATGGMQFGVGVFVITGGPTGFANAIANMTEASISRTVSANSIGIHGLGDFNATNPPGKTPLAGSGTATERLDQGNGTNYAQWIADWVGTAAGTFSFGPNNYTSLQVAQVFIEITGPAATAVGAQPLIVGQGAAIQRSHNW